MEANWLFILHKGKSAIYKVVKCKNCSSVKVLVICQYRYSQPRESTQHHISQRI